MWKVHGGMLFYKMASIVDDDDQGAYHPRFVNRSITMTWDAGWEVYQLIDPLGAVYTMQSFSKQIDYSLTFEDLAGLGSRLKLPAGWQYRNITLEHELNNTAVLATVLVDDLLNAYTRTQEAPTSPSPTPEPISPSPTPEDPSIIVI